MRQTLKNIWLKLRWPFAAALGLMLVGFLLWKRSARAKEIARLRTRIEQDSVLALRAKQDVIVEKNMEKVSELRFQIKHIQIGIAENRKKLEAEEAALAATNEQIQKLNDWAGLDAFNKRNR